MLIQGPTLDLALRCELCAPCEMRAEKGPRDYRALIFNSARDGKLERLKVFLEGRPLDWTRECLSPDPSSTPGCSPPPLVIAARNGHVQVVEYLIEKGANPRDCGTVAFDGEVVEGAPALWAASAAGHLPVVETLIKAGSDVDQTTNSRSSPLRGACYDGHLDVVRYLVSVGANVETGNRYGHTPLMIAAYRNKVDVVEFLLAAGANPRAASVKGNTALHDAAEAGCLTVACLLLAAGASVDARDEHGVTPLFCAAAMGFDEVVELLGQRASTSDRVDAWKLLGATLIDKRRDTSGAIELWQRALAIAAQCPVPPITTIHHSITLQEDECNMRSALLDDDRDKTLIAARERAYGSWQQHEFQSQNDLDRIIIDLDAIRIQALVIRERVLGIGHPETHYHIKYRGAIYADVGRLDRCIALWQYALSLQQRTWPALQATTRASLAAFVEMFIYCMNERALAGGAARGAQRAAPQIGVETVVEVLDVAIVELERVQVDLLPRDHCDREQPSTSSSRCPHDRPPTRADLESTMHICLQLIVMVGRLVPTAKSVPKEENDAFEMQSPWRAMMTRFETVCRLHCLRPLHVACEDSNRAASTRFPSMFAIREMLAVRAESVNEKNEKGETPLHVLLASERPRASMVKLMLEHGAEILARNRLDETCLQLIYTKLPMLRRQIRLGRFLHLRGLAANAIRRHHLDYYPEVIPVDLVRLVELH